MRMLFLVLAVTLVFAAAASGATTQVKAIHYPNSLAAIGDSWTAPNATTDSWATGTKKTVDSQYLRILAHNPAIRGHAYNLAEAHVATGPGINDLAFQARGAIARHVDYVAIALGENDVCGMTTKSVFRREFKAGLAHLTHALPNAHQLQELSPAGERALSATAWHAGYRFTRG